MPPDMLPERQPNLSAKINDQIAKMLINGTADLRKLKVGGIIEVTTTNTRYRIERLDDGDAEYPFLMSGHPRLCPEPVRASISGSTFDRGGGMLSIDSVGRGMFMEFHLAGHGRTFTTTEVAEVEEIASGDRLTSTTANTAADDRRNADRNDLEPSQHARESNPTPRTTTEMHVPDQPRGGTGNQPSRAAAETADGDTPAKTERLTPSIWLITSQEGVICNRSGWFGSKRDCQLHIEKTFHRVRTASPSTRRSRSRDGSTTSCGSSPTATACRRPSTASSHPGTRPRRTSNGSSSPKPAPPGASPASTGRGRLTTNYTSRRPSTGSGRPAPLLGARGPGTARQRAVDHHQRRRRAEGRARLLHIPGRDHGAHRTEARARSRRRRAQAQQAPGVAD